MEDTQLPTLYKLDSQGRKRHWWVEIYDDHFVTNAGLVEGKISKVVYDHNKIKPKGKNSFAEQVRKNAISKWTKKKDRECYQTDMACAAVASFIQPMLALDYTKVPHRADWENKDWAAQPKFNGVRCIAEYVDGKVKLTSRKGKEYTVDHIQMALKDLYENHPLVDNTVAFDGELYIHEVELGDVTHAVAHGSEELSFEIFDVVKDKESYRTRDMYLDSLNLVFPLHKVTTVLIKKETTLFNLHDLNVSNGYEGIMLKDLDGAYRRGAKTPAMFKYKKFQDSEFEITGTNVDKNGGAILVLKTDSNVSFTSRPMGSNATRERMFKDTALLVGKMATIRYSSLLASGVPEFNRTITIRDYE